VTPAQTRATAPPPAPAALPADLHEQVLGVVEDAIVVLDLEGRVVFWNRAADRLFGWTAEETSGRRLDECLPGDVRDVAREAVSRARQDLPFTGQVRLPRKDGSAVLVGFTTTPYRDAEGRSLGLIAVAHDASSPRAAVAFAGRNEALLRAVVDRVPETIVFAKDATGRCRVVNQAGAEAFGFTPEEMVGKHDRDLLPPEKADVVQAQDLEVMAGGHAITFEERIHLAGEEHSYLTTKVPWRDTDGRVVGVLGISHDITHRVRREEALRGSEARHRTLVEQSPLPVYTIALDGRVTSANPASQRIWDLPTDAVLGWNMLQDAQMEATGLQRAIRRAMAGEAVHLEATRFDPRASGLPGRVRVGGAQQVESHFYPIMDPAGRVREVVAILDDVTDHVEAEEGLAEANERLREVDRLKTYLINTASHELRTPLTPLILQLDLLRTTDLGSLSGVQRRALGVIERNTWRLAELVQDLLAVAQLQDGRIALAHERIDLAPVVRTAIKAHRPAAARSGVRLDARLGEGLHVDGDGPRLGQVLGHLLATATEASPRGGAVRLEAARRDGEVVVEVEDQGAGLTAEEQAQMFQPFGAITDPAGARSGRAGVGLVLSRFVVERLGGRVWAAPATEGPGAVIGFALPATGGRQERS
jgi:PAS domain S-box-containing protein